MIVWLLTLGCATAGDTPSKPATEAKAVSTPERLGRQVVDALKANDPAPLEAVPKGVSPEVVNEMKKTREVTLDRGFHDLRGKIEAAGMDPAAITFVRLADVVDGGFSPLGQAEVIITAPEAGEYRFSIAWMNVGDGAALLSTSTWLQPVE